MKNKNLIISVALVVLALLGGFFAGMQYQKSQRATFVGGMYGRNGMMRQFGQNGQNFRPVRGTVLSVDNNTMTIKLANGNSEIVVLSPSTRYVKSAPAALSDIKTGDTVMAIGTQNNDGSLTASDVQLNPAGFGQKAN